MTNDLNEINTELSNFLNNCSSLVILGIGNDIRGDDGLGPYIINKLIDLKEYNSQSSINVHFNEENEKNQSSINVHFNEENEKNQSSIDVHLINGGSVPENFTGVIKKANPSHIIFIDASLMNKKPGDISLYRKENISNVSISTHSMSLSFLIKYLEQDREYDVIFIGIEPKIMDLSLELSEEVKSSADDLVELLVNLIF